MRKPFDGAPSGSAEGLILKNSRGDWRSFEPLIAACVDAALSPTAETVVATQVLRIPA